MVKTLLKKFLEAFIAIIPIVFIVSVLYFV